jgi:hypothetical protein
VADGREASGEDLRQPADALEHRVVAGIRRQVMSEHPARALGERACNRVVAVVALADEDLAGDGERARR